MTPSTTSRVAVSDRRVQAEFALPASPEAEAMAIGQMLSKNALWEDYCQLAPEDFHDPLNRLVWGAVVRLKASGRSVDLFTVLSELGSMDGELPWLREGDLRRHVAESMGSVVSMLGSDHCVGVLRDLSEKRGLVMAAMELAHRAATEGCSTPAGDIAGDAVGRLRCSGTVDKDLVSSETLVDRVRADLAKPVEASATGMPRLDKALRGGFHLGRFYAFGGEMKVGKSTLLASISYNMAVGGDEPHVYVCAEMNPEQIFQKYLARYIHEKLGVDCNTDVFWGGDRRSRWLDEVLAEAREAFSEARGLRFLRRPRITLDQLKSVLHRIGLSGRYRGVFLDYMQLVGGAKGGNQTQHQDDVCQTIAEFVATYPMWVCAACQLNQEGGVRGGKGLEAAADVVYAIKRWDVGCPGDEAPTYKAALEMLATRYTPWTHIGDEDNPAYDFRDDAGPSYRELPLPAREADRVRDFARGMGPGMSPEWRTI